MAARLRLMPTLSHWRACAFTYNGSLGNTMRLAAAKRLAALLRRLDVAAERLTYLRFTRTAAVIQCRKLAELAKM